MRKIAIAVATASLTALPLAAQDAATEEDQPLAREVQQPAAESEAPAEAPAEEAPAESSDEAPAEEPAAEAAEPATEDAPDEPAEEEPAEEASGQEDTSDDAAPTETETVTETDAETAEEVHEEAEGDHAEDGDDHGDDGHATGHTEDYAFSFEGPFGTYDQNQLQRGLKIYTEVCSACHGLQYVSFRALSEEGGPGLPEDQVRAYASEFAVLDEDSNRQFYDPALGEFRTPIPADNFPANNTANAPDLSLMAKARAGFHGPYGTGINQFVKGMGGAEYIASLLTGYTGKEKEEYGAVFYENTAYPGGWISMGPPLVGEDVEFDDGHANDLENEAMDIAAFLMWTAEPKMMQRKETGFLIVGFLIVLSVLLYFTNKRLWAPHKSKVKNLDKEA